MPGGADSKSRGPDRVLIFDRYDRRHQPGAGGYSADIIAGIDASFGRARWRHINTVARTGYISYHDRIDKLRRRVSLERG